MHLTKREYAVPYLYVNADSVQELCFSAGTTPICALTPPVLSLYLAHTKASAVPIGAQVLPPRCIQLGPQLFERDDVLPDLRKAAQQFPVSHVQLGELRCQLAVRRSGRSVDTIAVVVAVGFSSAVVVTQL